MVGVSTVVTGSFHILPGHILLAPDPDEVRRGVIWYSDRMARKSETGLVVQHAQAWLEEDLTGKRVLVEKWAWRPLQLQDTQFYVVDERSIYAVLEEHTAPIEA